MNNFKVGDNVRVVKSINNFIFELKLIKGRTVGKVMNRERHGAYRVKFKFPNETSHLFFRETELELVKEEK